MARRGRPPGGDQPEGSEPAPRPDPRPRGGKPAPEASQPKAGSPPARGAKPPPASAPDDLAVSRADPVPEDLSESTAFAVLSESEVRRLDDEPARADSDAGSSPGASSDEPLLLDSVDDAFPAGASGPELELGSVDPDDLAESRAEPVPGDLSESTAVLLFTQSDVRRMDSGGLASSSDPDLAISRADPVPDDLSESTAVVVMSGSDVRRLDTSGSAALPPAPQAPAAGRAAAGGAGAPSPPKGARAKGSGGPERKPPRAGAGAAPPPPPSRFAWFVAGGVAVAWLLSAGGIWAVTRSRHEDERRALEARLQSALDHERRLAEELGRTLEGERAAHAREAEALRGAAARADAARADGEAELVRERERMRHEKAEAVRDLDDALKRQRERAVAEAEARAKLRAARERIDLEGRARDTVARYEALLAQADEANQKALEVIEREARADRERREALFQSELDARVAKLEAEKAEAIRLETERIEERLRLEITAARGGGGDDGLLGSGDEGGEGLEQGIDLEAEVWEHLSGHLSGSAEYRLFAHFAKGDAALANQARNEGMFRLRYEVDPFDWLTLRAEPRVHIDDDSLGQGSQTDIVDDRERRPIFTLEEAFASASFGDLDLRAGKLVLAQGTADLFNPTDAVNPTDFTDLIDSRKIGIPAVEAAYYLDDGEIKLLALWAPFFTPGRFARAGERFSPAPEDLPVPISPREEPATRLDASEVLFRLETSVEGYDFSFTALTQINPIPNLEARVDLSIPSLALVPVFDRRYMIGADLSTVFFEEWIVNVEVAQFITDGGRDDDYLLFVLGLRRAFYPFDRELTAIIEYVGEWVERAASDPNVIASPFQRIFANAVLGRLTFTPIEHLDLQLTGAVLFDGPESYYLQPEVRYAIGNHTRITAGFDLFAGPEGTFFGTLDADSRFYLMLKLAF